MRGDVLMRKTFGKTVEDGRLLHGEMKTQHGETFGFFFLARGRGNTRKLKVMVGDGDGWDHVSVSRPNHNECPTWDDMCWIKNLFFDANEAVFQVHPRVADYVNFHPGCLHMWRPHGDTIPRPPPLMVGPK